MLGFQYQETPQEQTSYSVRPLLVAANTEVPLVTSLRLSCNAGNGRGSSVLCLDRTLFSLLPQQLAKYFLEPWKLEHRKDIPKSDNLSPVCAVSLAIGIHPQTLRSKRQQ